MILCQKNSENRDFEQLYISTLYKSPSSWFAQETYNHDA